MSETATRDWSDDLDLLAAELALGTLEGAERQQALKLATTNPRFAVALAHWRATFAPLDETAPAVPPSPDLWARIDAGLGQAEAPAAARAAAPATTGPSRLSSIADLWSNLTFWRNAGMAAAFASLMLALGLSAVLMRPPESPVYVAVLNSGDGKAAAVVNAFADGRVELIPLERIAVPEGRIIEVWTLQTRERGPVSIGRMNEARKLKLNLRDLARPEANHLFELTLEPAGGSPTGKPTGPILMKGLAARSI